MWVVLVVVGVDVEPELSSNGGTGGPIEALRIDARQGAVLGVVAAPRHHNIAVAQLNYVWLILLHGGLAGNRCVGPRLRPYRLPGCVVTLEKHVVVFAVTNTIGIPGHGIPAVSQGRDVRLVLVAIARRVDQKFGT